MPLDNALPDVLFGTYKLSDKIQYMPYRTGDNLTTDIICT